VRQLRRYTHGWRSVAHDNIGPPHRTVQRSQQDRWYLSFESHAQSPFQHSISQSLLYFREEMCRHQHLKPKLGGVPREHFKTRKGPEKLGNSKPDCSVKEAYGQCHRCEHRLHSRAYLFITCDRDESGGATCRMTHTIEVETSRKRPKPNRMSDSLLTMCEQMLTVFGPECI
jgi:hypothetical protein